MSISVFAENMGLFHKGSGGSGVAPLDVCLSPPPPPAGPVPIPYVNTLSAGDLTKGSKTVKADGEPTALEDASEVSTSTGDEGGTQGGGVVTHKTKGKGAFTLWSFTVKIEGKGVCRHGDMMQQNEASTPGNIICMRASVKQQAAAFGYTKTYQCTPCELAKFKRHAPTDAQKEKANKEGRAKGCWSCGRVVNRWTRNDGSKATSSKWTADHQPVQKYVWEHMGGCKGACGTAAEKKACFENFKSWATDIDTCKPHCRVCSNSQGGWVSQNSGLKLVRQLLKVGTR